MISLQQFITHIREEHLIADGQRVLLAVSGGRDSVTLFDLMCRAGFNIGVAHCNFNLRPGDCDRDEAFVRDLAAAHSVPCHVAHFDTLAFAKQQGLSVEEAARLLRYRFFEELRSSEGYDLIATAHHRDDSIETFFINLLRGTGIGGLHGIPVRNGAIVRPLLSYGRDEIDAYVSQQSLAFVDDYTNAQTLYLRNRIRHQLMPLLREISPSFDSVMEDNISHFADADSIYRAAIARMRDDIVSEDGSRVVIDIPKLRHYEPLATVLFELLRPYGFNSVVAAQVASSLDAQSGKRFFSPSHCILKDRSQLIISPLEPGRESASQDDIFFLISESTDLSLLPIPLSMSITPFDGTIPHLSCGEAWFDRDGLQFPLQLRHWHDGDRFRPFGMKGTRLVSDLFSDLKLSLDEKEKTWLLCNGDHEGTILWVVGHRASHFAIVNTKTTKIVKLKLNSY